MAADSCPDCDVLDLAKVHKVRLVPFFEIGSAERAHVMDALTRPLSGYLGGVHTGGHWVEKLQHNWANEFEVEHAIACNSATSGLLAACLAVGIGRNNVVWVTCYSMSATAAPAILLGARVKFLDIETETFGAVLAKTNDEKPKAVIITHLFGAPARDLTAIATICRAEGIWLIEDCAQAPFAKVAGGYAGTVGDIGVFSLNVHKHIQAGEGGVIVTRNDFLAEKCMDVINHGELAPNGRVGLNLRMTEPSAAIACAQLQKAHRIIQRKVALGEMLSDAVEGLPIHPPKNSVYYCWTGLCQTPAEARNLAQGLAGIGLPARWGYSRNLVDVFKQYDEVPIARHVDHRLVVVDCCQIDPSASQMRALGRMVRETATKALPA